MKHIPLVNILFLSIISLYANCQVKTNNDGLNITSDSAAISLLTNQFYQTLSFESSNSNKYDSLSNLFIRQGLLITTIGKEAQFFTVDQYIEGAKKNFVKQQISAWDENELCAKTDVFGKVAQRFSTYKIKLVSNEKESIRTGINAMQLIKQNGKWIITVVSWDKETETIKIPGTYLCQ
jgi:hypothetical protein